MAEQGKWGIAPVQGHDLNWKLLTSKEPPDRMHFLGPEGVGRKKFARDLHHTLNGGRTSGDYYYERNPTVEQVASLRELCDMPIQGTFRTICIEVDMEELPRLQSALISLLDYESETKIILITTGELPEPLSSRVFEYVFFPLSDDTIRKILVDKQTPPEHIERFVQMADGTMANSGLLRLLAEDQTNVLALMDAILDNRLGEITALRNKWSPRTTQMLRSWLRESLTGSWKQFAATDDRPLTRPAKMALLRATSKRARGAYPEIRRTAEDIMRGGSGA